MSRRAEPIAPITARVDGPLKSVIDVWHALFGKVESLVDVLLLFETAGHTVTNAAAGAGTAVAFTRVLVDFADAGVDSVRVMAYGNNSAAGSVIVTVHDVTNNVELCRVTLTDATPAAYAGDWTTIIPTGTEQELEVRVIGDGAFDPVLYNVHLQGRTTQARA